jgi:hypothetical protein
MVQTTMSTVDGILKEVYEDSLQDQLQSEVLTLRRIERSSEGVTHEIGGKYVTFPIRTQRNHGIGARGESQALPPARLSKYVPARVRLKYLYGSLELTGQVFELADKNFQAFSSALDQEVEGLRQGLAKDNNRQVYGTPVGKVAVATSAGATNTLVTTNGQYLEEGMFLDLFTSADAVRVADVEVTKVVTDAAGVTTATFLPAAGATTAVGDYATRDGSKDKELTGLTSIVAATGQLYDIDPANTSVWASTVAANGGTPRALSEGLMIKMADDVRRGGGGQPTVIFTTVGVRRSYFNLLVQTRRTSNTQKFTGGFEGLAFTTDQGDIPVVSDFDCPPNRMYFTNEKEIKLYEAGDWSFMDRDGSRWQRVITAAGTFDAYAATLYKYAEIGTHRRNAHGLLADIIEG